jgi:hypothetical protein
MNKIKIIVPSIVCLLSATGAFAQPTPANLYDANCLSSDGLNLSLGQVTYTILFGEAAPMLITVDQDNLAGYLACNSTQTACAGINEIDGSIMKASVKQTKPDTYLFDFGNNFSFSCGLPI